MTEGKSLAAVVTFSCQTSHFGGKDVMQDLGIADAHINDRAKASSYSSGTRFCSFSNQFRTMIIYGNRPLWISCLSLRGA